MKERFSQLKTKYQAYHHPRLHLWLGMDLLLLCAIMAARYHRDWMNWFTTRVTAPFRVFLGRISYCFPFSVMEALYVVAVLVVLAWLIWAVVSIRRAAGRRKAQSYLALLLAVCTGLSVYNGFWLLWGINFWADGFQERSGIYARPVAIEELYNLTAYFTVGLMQTAEEVTSRDENGAFNVSWQEILDSSPGIYGAMEEEFPFLEFDDPGAKPMFFSRLMSRMDFTGFYCSYTGESNVNVDAPTCLLPATVAHELAHQRGIASEQECNFLGVMAAISSGDPNYRYSGWLSGFIYLGNALYAVAPDAYWALRDALPACVEVDLAENRAYWDQFQHTHIQKVSNKFYDTVLKTYGDERGIRSYGMVVDLLVAYFIPEQ